MGYPNGCIPQVTLVVSIRGPILPELNISQVTLARAKYVYTTVYSVTMQITFPVPEFARKERNSYCDDVHIIDLEDATPQFKTTCQTNYCSYLYTQYANDRYIN